ncbi:MAG: hypothetical protein ACE5E7_19375 [Anaerolineae bacterium]
MFVQRKLRQQAKIDYRQARGTAHKALLQGAKEQLTNRQKEIQRLLTSAQEELQRLRAERKQKLSEALAKHLVANHLQEVPGIGTVRQRDLIENVFRGRLEDLHRAHQQPGIGIRTQNDIDFWIIRYQRKFDTLFLRKGSALLFDLT